MRIALISDIHANLEALTAVLADIDRRIDTAAGDQIWNLGDIIGYGPDPVACADLVASRCKWSLLGNHDYGVLYEPTNFNAVAEQAAYWTRAQFEAEGERDQATAVRRWEFLGKLRVRVSEGPFLCVHGTPRRPINEYLFPEDAQSSPSKMQSIFERIERSGASYCLVGHTHVPGVFTADGDFYPPKEMGDATWTIDGKERLIINPGSVGQPRDLDPRASYAIVEADTETGPDGKPVPKPRAVQFFRLEYDIASARAKIARVAEDVADGRAVTRDDTGCLVQLMRLPGEPAGPWLERQIAELEARRAQSKKGSELEILVQGRIAACRKLSEEIAARKDATTNDLRQMLRERDPLHRPEMERYNWLGARLAEGR